MINKMSIIIHGNNIDLSELQTINVGNPVINHTLRITTYEIEPYVIPNKYIKTNSSFQYEGFIIDLIGLLSHILHFNYIFKLVSDGEFGHRQSDGTWNGLIGEILNNNADVAAAPMFITEFRAKVVDFTDPFLDIYASLLLRRPPSGTKSPINHIVDIINQSEIKYGTMSSSIMTYNLKNSNDSVFEIIWRNMNRYGDETFTDTNDEGIEKVRHDKYAFFIPSDIGQYISSGQPCDLFTIETNLMRAGYGLSMKKDSELLPFFNKAIFELKQRGYLNKLYKKWWFHNSECPSNNLYTSLESNKCSQNCDVFVLFSILVISRNLLYLN